MPNRSTETGKASDALRVMELSTAITRLSTARNQVLNRMAAPFGLTAVQMMALHHVSVTPASTPSNLARNLAVDSASVTRLLDRLDNKGMIQRATQERVDRTQDRRVIEIVLTERGINVMRELNPHWQSALSELTEAFKQSEIHGLALTD
ncbi:MAG: MarR family transcriptional regulator [Burkholderiales bacterium]|uniref:MarR family transcriptional regulator n=2 Tax=Pseudomonadota TaxID=1224 RepID=A0A853FU95_9BURK|nr:MarR family transcriptional regulator [Burkholderiales bacterium]NYT47719.1 MarR family transcriptional regulator [Parapusillimonas granuli]PUY61089.1 MarR family transcriptional regulator [Cronobacter sakazakii]HBP0984046.1 MarR family transcriptional regulator [Pseudomonas aeruginosa]